MTSKELKQYIGLKGFYLIGSLRVRVKVKAAKWNFGRVDLSITPMSGDGEQWISEANLFLDNPPEVAAK